MNNRIQELIDQANKYAAEKSEWRGDQTEWEREFEGIFNEKFAELIVQECAKFTFKYTSDEKNIQEYNKIGWDLLSGDLRDAIKEHFGVEP